MRKFLAIALAAFLALVPAVAFSAADVTINPSRGDVATFLQGPAGGSTACSTVNTTVANGTVTITPPAGYYVVITGVYIDVTEDATGLTGTQYFSSTNIVGSPVWSVATVVASTVTSSVRHIIETYPTGLRSQTAGTAVTLVPSAQSNHIILCARVAGYFLKAS